VPVERFPLTASCRGQFSIARTNGLRCRGQKSSNTLQARKFAQQTSNCFFPLTQASFSLTSSDDSVNLRAEAIKVPIGTRLATGLGEELDILAVSSVLLDSTCQKPRPPNFGTSRKTKMTFNLLLQKLLLT